MAGISGIIALNPDGLIRDTSIFERMIAGIKAEVTQEHRTFHDENVFISVVSQTRSSPEANFYYDQEHGIISALDGFCFIDEQTAAGLVKDENFPKGASALARVGQLYIKLGKEVFKHLRGSFNLFIYDVNKRECILGNDRFGFYPMYHGQSTEYLIFSSKLGSIVNSGLIQLPQADLASLIEHLYFGYVISEHSYVQGVCTLSNASLIKVEKGKVATDKYWEMTSEYGKDSLSKKHSIDAIDQGLKAAISRIAQVDDALSCSITGGWDSRVVLSYLLPRARKRLYCYSFGANDAPDVTIPQLISRKESFRYRPFGLDHTYLDNDFIAAAKDTIKLSSGTRNYKRTHYLYALKQMGAHSQHQISGIFGDQVFKVGKPKGNIVLNQVALKCLESNFELDYLNKSLQTFLKAFLPDHDNKELLSELLYRMVSLKDQFSIYVSASERFVAFRFEINLRRYFGNEASSYNDYALCYSPFTDYDFVKTWLSTFYAGQLYPFQPATKAMQINSGTLYATLVKRNYKPLIYYPTARGYTMADTLSFFGGFRILMAKLQREKNAHKDAFSTKDTVALFQNMLAQEKINCSFNIGGLKGSNAYDDAQSLCYWLAIHGLAK
jgi:asparagine synthetase B (glutamine-hydrolysing)